MDDDGRLERKSDMFTKRTIQPHRPVEHTETAVEALAVSMNEKARVDMEYMARLCGKSEDEVAAELQGVIFRVPGTERYVTADEYLSGNVRQKLHEAEAAAESEPSFSVNADALRAAQPRELTASEIDVRLGATWIEPQYIRQFIDETFKPSFWASQNIKVHYSPDVYKRQEWNTPAAATALGTAVSENTQLVLREIERTIRSYERSRYNDRNNLQDRERRANPQPDPARDEMCIRDRSRCTT